MHMGDQARFPGYARYATKTALRFHFFIKELLYPPKPAQHTGYIIAKASGYYEPDKKTNTLAISDPSGTSSSAVPSTTPITPGQMIVTTIKGIVPYAAPYFFYTVYCVEERDPQYGSFLKVKSIIDFQRTTNVTVQILEWMIRRELEYSPIIWGKIISQIFPNQKLCNIRGNVVVPLNKLNEELRQNLHHKADFYRFDSLERLLKSFPAGAAKIKRLTHNEQDKLLKKIDDSPWLFVFSKWCLKYEPKQKTQNSSSLTFSAMPYSNAMCLSESMTLNALKTYYPDQGKLKYDAIETYHTIQRWLKKRGSTVFSTYYCPPSLKRSGHFEKYLSLLTDEAKVIHKEIINGSPLFSLETEYHNCQKLLDFYQDLWDQISLGELKISPLYEENSKLNQNQKKALQAIRTEPIINVFGMPGRGKTTLIEEIVRKYGSDQVAVHTFVGSMVAALRERGIERADTIHSAINRRNYLEREARNWSSDINCVLTTAGQKVKNPYQMMLNNEFENKRILVVDEFTNVDNALASSLYELYPNVLRVIHAFDPMQIGSIEPGNLAIDLKDALTGTPSNIELMKQMRVTKKEAQGIVWNDEMLIKKKLSDFQYRRVNLVENPTFADMINIETTQHKSSEKDFSSFDKSDSVSSSSIMVPKKVQGWTVIHRSYKTSSKLANRRLKAELQCLTSATSILGASNPLINIESTKDWQILTLTNYEKNVCNQFFESKYNSLPNCIRFYPGQRITIIDRNFKERIMDPKNPSNSKSAAVRNGEVYVFDYCRDYDLKKHCFVDKKYIIQNLRNDTIYPIIITRYLRFIFTACGRAFCLHPKVVPIEHIKPAWALTVNKSQGREYKNVLFVLPQNKDDVAQCFNIHHLHVAISRPKENLYILGNMSIFRYIAFSPVYPRETSMRYRLRRIFEKKRSPNVEYKSTSKPFQLSATKPMETFTPDQRTSLVDVLERSDPGSDKLKTKCLEVKTKRRKRRRKRRRCRSKNYKEHENSDIGDDDNSSSLILPMEEFIELDSKTNVVGEKRERKHDRELREDSEEDKYYFDDEIEFVSAAHGGSYRNDTSLSGESLNSNSSGEVTENDDDDVESRDSWVVESDDVESLEKDLGLVCANDSDDFFDFSHDSSESSEESTDGEVGKIMDDLKID